MPIFIHKLQRIDENNAKDAIRKMANHINYIQEQLEYTLMNLDSRNITEIDTDQTAITNSSNSASIGSMISLSGSKGERFIAGKDSSGKFEFSVSGADGEKKIFMDSAGELQIAKTTGITLDGGDLDEEE